MTFWGVLFPCTLQMSYSCSCAHLHKPAMQIMLLFILWFILLLFCCCYFVLLLFSVLYSSIHDAVLELDLRTGALLIVRRNRVLSPHAIKKCHCVPWHRAEGSFKSGDAGFKRPLDWVNGTFLHFPCALVWLRFHHLCHRAQIMVHHHCVSKLVIVVIGPNADYCSSASF